MTGGSKGSGIARAFRHRDFAIYSAASGISNIGMWVMRIGIGWFTWELTHSGAWLGAIVAAQALPSIILVPFAGALADRFDRLLILRLTQVGSLILSAGIAAMILLDMVDIYVLAGYAFAHGIVGTFGIPARVTIGPNLVPKEDISVAIAVSSVVFGSATFIGPAVAGLIINWIGIGYTFALNSLTFLIMYFALGMISLARTENKESGSSLWSDVVDGVRYVAGHGGILPVIILTISTAVLVRPLTELLPGFADVIFGRGAEGLAAMMSAFGIGGMAASLWLANRNRIEGTTTILLLGTATSGVLTAVFASTDSFAAALAIMVVLGAAGSATMNGAQILIQNAVEGSMRARVMSLYSFNYRAAPALGAMAMGGASTVVGLQFPVAAGALLLLAIWYWVFLRRRRLRQALETGGGAPLEARPKFEESPAEQTPSKPTIKTGDWHHCTFSDNEVCIIIAGNKLAGSRGLKPVNGSRNSKVVIMNSITPHSAIDDAYLSRSDEANLIEGRLQLEDEAYARKRRIRNRRQRQAKLQALGRIQRRNRAIKLAVFWAGAVALGTFVVIWNAGEIMQVFAHALRAV